jgi:glycogen operon protein
MLLAGDEIGNSQGGNNNSYCQDNETGWIDWSGRNISGQDLTDFVARLIASRRGCGLSHEHFLEGKIRNPSGRKDIAWYRIDGQEMTEPDWHFPDARFIAVAVDGAAPALILLNAHFEPLKTIVPAAPSVTRWRIEIDTTEANGTAKGALVPGDSFEVPARALLMLLGETGPESASLR